MEDLQSILEKTTKRKDILGISLCVRHKEEEWLGLSGNFTHDEAYFIASTSKLFISTLIFRLRNQGKLRLEDRISKFLPKEILHNLHVYKGRNYSNELTITHLLAHTSGLPDYFQSRLPHQPSLESRLKKGEDVAWDVQQAIKWSKEMQPPFEPAKSQKAQYSDTNYQLLGKIIENLYGDSLEAILPKEIYKPLGLTQTYLYVDPLDASPKPLHFKSQPLHIPKAMCSFWADGGIVSTSGEMMSFLTAFMTGKLFPLSYLSEICTWKRIFFPYEYGIGIQRFKPPWFFSPFQRMPEMIGHAGLSGAFAFYVPEMELYMTGTVNQIHNPGNSIKLMMKVVSKLLGKG